MPRLRSVASVTGAIMTEASRFPSDRSTVHDNSACKNIFERKRNQGCWVFAAQARIVPAGFGSSFARSRLTGIGPRCDGGSHTNFWAMVTRRLSNSWTSHVGGAFERTAQQQ